MNLKEWRLAGVSYTAPWYEASCLPARKVGGLILVGEPGTYRFGAGRDAVLGNARSHFPGWGRSARTSPPAKLARRLENGTARILSATVSRTAQRWFVSFAVEVERDLPERHARPGSAVGVDLGIKTLLTAVDDPRARLSKVVGAKPLRVCPAEAAPRVPRLIPASSPGRRTAVGRRPSSLRLHAKAANIRADALHKATTALAARYETVVVEDLNVTGMISNRKLARAVSDQGFGETRRMLAYKTEREGGTLVSADRWFPQFQDLLGVRMAKAKPDARRARVHLRAVRPGHRPGCQRGP